MLKMISETLMDVQSYEALKSGRKGIGNRTHTQILATKASIFHFLLILCLINDDIVI